MLSLSHSLFHSLSFFLAFYFCCYFFLSVPFSFSPRFVCLSWALCPPGRGEREAEAGVEDSGEGKSVGAVVSLKFWMNFSTPSWTPCFHSALPLLPPTQVPTLFLPDVSRPPPFASSPVVQRKVKVLNDTEFHFNVRGPGPAQHLLNGFMSTLARNG